MAGALQRSAPVTRSSSPATTASTSCRSRRRRECSRSRRRRSRATRSRPRRSAWRALRRGDPRRRPGRERCDHAGDPRRPGAGADPGSIAAPPVISRCSTPAPRSTPAAAPTRWPRGWRPPRRRSTPAPPPRRSAIRRRDPAPGRMNELERIVARTRGEVDQRRARPPLRELGRGRGQPARARPDPRVHRGAGGARTVGDRRAQAPLAERRGDPVRPRARGRRDAPTNVAARGPCRC